MDREEQQELKKRRQRIFFLFFFLGWKSKVDLTASEQGEGGEGGTTVVLPNSVDGS